MVGDAEAGGDAAQGRAHERVKGLVWVVGLERGERHPGRQHAEGARLRVHVRHAVVVLGVGHWIGAAVLRREPAHLRGADAGGDHGRFLEARQVLHPRHGGVHPWHAARLLWALRAVAVVDLLGRHPLPAVDRLPFHRRRVRGQQPVRDRAAGGRELDAHHHTIAAGEHLVAVDVESVDVEHLQREAVGVVRAFDLAHQVLAVARRGLDQQLLDVDERQLASDLADAAPGPVGEGALDRGVGDGVEIAVGEGGLALQREAVRPDDVRLAHLQVALGVVVVLRQVPRAAAQRLECSAKVVVDRRVLRRPAREQALVLRGDVLPLGEAGRRRARLRPRHVAEAAGQAVHKTGHQRVTRSVAPESWPAAMRAARSSLATSARQ